MSHETLTKNSIVEKDYKNLNKSARMYAKHFTLGQEEVQNRLPDMPVFRHDVPDAQDEDREFFGPKHPDHVMLTRKEYEWDLAYRACIDGLIGGMYFGDDDISDIVRLAVELVQNNYPSVIGQRKEKIKYTNLEVLTADELSKEVSAWYILGESARLSGTLIDRGIQNRSEAIALEDLENPLASQGLDDMDPFARKQANDVASAIDDILFKEFIYTSSDIGLLLSHAADKAGVNIDSLPVAYQESLKLRVRGILNPEDEDGGEDYYDD
jgi:hypothetical protein